MLLKSFQIISLIFNLFIFKSLSSSSSSQCSSLLSYNDDYCDCLNGEDEIKTSACSERGNIRYFCPGSGILNISIPTSRVQDGICDCCDGSDEKNSPFHVNCPNSCPEMLQAFKRQTLIEYRKISSGLQAKNELVSVMKRNKIREEQSYQSLLNELDETQKLYARMKILLQNEKNLESNLQFEEVRKRVRDCADKFLPVCDIFGDGINYIEEDTSLPINLFGNDKEEEEDIYLNDNNNIDNNNDIDNNNEENRQKKLNEERKLIEEEAKKKETIRDDIRKSTMTALQRVQASYCSYIEQDTRGILIEETPRIHKSINQYMSYTLGRGGIADRKRERQIDVIRKKTTLFGKYLDNGDAGLTLGAQVLSEFIGIILSPITIPLTLLNHQWKKFETIFWRQIKKCSSKNNNNNDDDYNNDNSIDFDDEDNSKYHKKKCSKFIKTLANLFKEEGLLSRIIDVFDYTQYNILVRLAQRLLPITTRIQWYSTIIQQAPWYYYRYYFSSNGISRLPVKRDACTLREGIRVAEDEIKSLKEKIENRKNEDIKKKEIKSQSNNNNNDNNNGQCSDSEILSSNGVCYQKQIDYSPDGSWEAIQGTCIEKDDGKYLYKFCFFDSSYQGSTKLGTFHGWGDRSLYVSNENNEEEKKGRFGKFMSKKSSLFNSITKPVNSLLEQVGITAGNQEKVTVDYTKQYYSGGERCYNGIVRHTIVHFHCNTTSSIDEVTEYEICSYLMKVGTPLACSLEKERELLDRLKNLEVLGFQP